MSKYLKCAHPDCSSDFDYGQGRLFRFHRTSPQDQQPAHSHSVRHFWLCTRCCKTYTIAYQKGSGVLLLQRLETLRGGQPSHFVLHEDAAVAAPGLARRVARSDSRQSKRKREVAPLVAGAVEMHENRNMERRG